MIGEWLNHNEERLKIASLIVALLVLLVAIYRWLILKWRSDVNIREYAEFESMTLDESKAELRFELDLPRETMIKISLRNTQGQDSVSLDQKCESGLLSHRISMEQRAPGSYELIVTTDDQRIFKRIEWSGLN